MKKIIKIGIPIFILIIVYIYVLMIESIPNNITIFQGENIQIKQLWGIGLNKQNNEEIVEASSNKNKNTINQVNTEKIKISLLDKINIKNVNIDILPKTKVIPVGSVAGVKLYTNGVLVVEASKISGALITADFALEQGKEVFALPGDITREQSEGCNELIKDGANIITNSQDIFNMI